MQELQKRHKKEMTQVQRKIDKVRQCLESNVNLKYKLQRKAIGLLTTRQDRDVQHLEALYAKQNQGCNYETKEEHNKALKAQIAKADAMLKER